MPAPATAPMIAVTQIQRLRHTLRFTDAGAPQRRGKPRGVERLQLFKYVGATPPPSPQHATFVGDITRQPATVELTSAEAGMNAYYFGRWATRNGLPGPFSEEASTPIVA